MTQNYYHDGHPGPFPFSLPNNPFNETSMRSQAPPSSAQKPTARASLQEPKTKKLNWGDDAYQVLLLSIDCRCRELGQALPWTEILADLARSQGAGSITQKTLSCRLNKLWSHRQSLRMFVPEPSKKQRKDVNSGNSGAPAAAVVSALPPPKRKSTTMARTSTLWPGDADDDYEPGPKSKFAKYGPQESNGRAGTRGRPRGRGRGERFGRAARSTAQDAAANAHDSMGAGIKQEFSGSLPNQTPQGSIDYAPHPIHGGGRQSFQLPHHPAPIVMVQQSQENLVEGQPRSLENGSSTDMNYSAQPQPCFDAPYQTSQPSSDTSFTNSGFKAQTNARQDPPVLEGTSRTAVSGPPHPTHDDNSNNYHASQGFDFEIGVLSDNAEQEDHKDENQSVLGSGREDSTLQLQNSDFHFSFEEPGHDLAAPTLSVDSILDQVYGSNSGGSSDLADLENGKYFDWTGMGEG